MKNSSLLAISFWVSIVIIYGLEFTFTQLETNKVYFIITSFIVAILPFAWAIEHAKEQSFDLTVAYKVGIFLFSPIAVPVYLIKQKGLKQGCISTIKIYLLAFLVLVVLGLYATFISY